MYRKLKAFHIPLKRHSNLDAFKTLGGFPRNKDKSFWAVFVLNLNLQDTYKLKKNKYMFIKLIVIIRDSNLLLKLKSNFILCARSNNFVKACMNNINFFLIYTVDFWKTLEIY